MSNTACGAASTSLAIVKARCEGLTSCSTPATNTVFGDPCGGTYKYLATKYQCITSTTSFTSSVCENSYLSISCASGQIMSITTAVYGRGETSTCVHSAMSDIGCAASGSLSSVQTLCNGKTSCGVPASNSQFGDPCVGTYKYLNVAYSCADSTSSLSGFVCEGYSLTLSCATGKKLTVTAATYGRSNTVTCIHSAMSNTACSASASLSTVQSSCNNQNSCTVSASNSVFGDPCGGTYKYLTATYTCA